MEENILMKNISNFYMIMELWFIEVYLISHK